MASIASYQHLLSKDGLFEPADDPVVKLIHDILHPVLGIWILCLFRFIWAA